MAKFDNYSKIGIAGMLALALSACNGSLGDLASESTITPATGSCPVGTLATASVVVFGKTFPVCVLTQNITSNVFLTNDHIYVLQNTIHIGDGDVQAGPSGSGNAVVTIQPGTQIFASKNTATVLVVTRGSRIEAVGTPDRPIIFGSVTTTGLGADLQITDDPANLNDRGTWGGLVLSGRGINNHCANTPGGSVQAEAVPTGVQRFHGCSNNADSSGTVEYVVIAESGFIFRPNQEVQGLTIESAGANTRINYLQIVGSNDDGIEWFGGAASASNIVVNGADDDGIDFDEGVQLTVQNVLIIQGAFGDKGIEADNAGPSNDATPVSNVNFVNLTILGNNGSSSSTTGLHYKVGFGGAMWRSAIVDNSLAGTRFDVGCLDLDDQIDHFIAFRDVAVNCANGTQVPPGFGVASGLAAGFVNGGNDEAGAVTADRRDFTLHTGAINPNTLAVDPGVAPDNSVAPPPAVNANPVGNYFGAVNPSSGNPDGNPNNNGGGGGPFWDGWTYINSAVDGNLPGANFHPLQLEIQ